MSDGNIYRMVEMLTQLTIRSVDHIMARIRREALKSGQPVSEFIPLFLDPQWNRVASLLEKAAALPDTQPKAADLALSIDRLVNAKGYFYAWLPIVEGLAVAMDYGNIEDKLQLARLWACVARCYQYLGDATRASIALRSAEVHSDGQNEASWDFLRELHLTKGGIRIGQLRYEEAEALFRQLLDDAEALGDSETALFGHDLAAYYYLHTYNFRRAFDHGQQVFVLAIARKDSIRRLRGLHCMAEALRINKRLGLADRYLQMAYEQAKTLNDQPWLAYLEYSFGTLAVMAEDYPRAIVRLKKARGLFQDTSNRPGEVNSIESLGFALLQAGEYEEAELVLLEAIRGLKEIKNGFELAQTYYGLGMVYARQDRRPLAHDAWNQARHQLDKLPGHEGHVRELLDKIQDATTDLTN